LAERSVLKRSTFKFELWLAALVLGAISPARADILWSDLGVTPVLNTGPGHDILSGAVKATEASTNTLYFKFHVNPQSDAGTEEYFAAFELYEGEAERLAVGNALKAWAYGAFNVDYTGKTNFNIFEAGLTNTATADWGKTNNVPGNWGIDLHSSKPTSDGHGGFFDYELVRKGIERTIVFKVQYGPGRKDAVTVWLDPDLAPGATEESQIARLTTQFTADASFNQIRLRHGGSGDGWTFSEMAIATSFSDFVMDDKLPFAFRVWQREQGLPQNLVRALAQTRDGYIWVGSDDGVSRFDGVRFVSFGLPEGFQAGPVQTLLGDSRGALWIGSVGRGLWCWQDGRFRSFTTRNGLPADSVAALAEDGQGRLWVGTASGLAVWENGSFNGVSGVEEFRGKPITGLFNDRKGTMWIGSKGAGVFRMRGGKLAALRDTGYDPLLRDPRCLLVDHEGRIWVGVGDGSVLCREGSQWRLYHLARHYISVLAEDAEGTVWAGSGSEGLFHFRHGKLVAINASSGLSDNLVEALLVDREGKLWVGAHGGLNRLRPKNVSVLSYNEGLGSGAAQGLAEVAPGLIWASKSNEGLYFWDGRYFRSLWAKGLSPSDERLGALLTAKDGSCWIAGARGLLQVRNLGTVESQGGLLALSNVNVSALGQDAKGGVWAGTQQGALWHYRSGQWLTQTNGPCVHALTAIVPGGNGSMWVGSDGDGLYRVAANGGGRWEKQSGLLSDWIRTLHRDADGVLWIGTGGGGLSRLAGEKVVTFTMREGLPDNTVSQILEDDNGRLWLGGNRGIVCVRKRDLADQAEHRIPEVYPQVYGREEGMLSEECLSGVFPIGLKTKSGALWFPTQQGIVVADSHRRTVDALAPAVVLEETLVDGVPAAEPLRLAPGSHRLEFRYTGLCFDDPERVRFRYRLDNLDSQWMEAGSSRSASYPYVPHGQYRFQVIACNGDGVWNATGASLAFTVRPHLWQTWWFMGLLVISIVGAARLAEKRTLQRRLKNLERERAIQVERARIAQDLHDDLGSTLTRISLLSGLARADKEVPGQVEIHVNKISQCAAQTLRALEEIVWALRPGSDTLQSLVEYIAHFADELFEENRLRCRLDLPADLPPLPLPPEMRHNIFLIVKEALTNALKHSAAREAFVQAKVSRGTLDIVVHDDGHGFDPSSPERAKGNGLGNMRRRAEAMGGALVIESAGDQGVTVRLTVPLPAAAVNGNGQRAYAD
jgi:signal transduction histidine kinase/ligand-binding sensor domain-containing protein